MWHLREPYVQAAHEVPFLKPTAPPGCLASSSRLTPPISSWAKMSSWVKPSKLGLTPRCQFHWPDPKNNEPFVVLTQIKGWPSMGRTWQGQTNPRAAAFQLLTTRFRQLSRNTEETSRTVWDIQITSPSLFSLCLHRFLQALSSTNVKP